MSDHNGAMIQARITRASVTFHARSLVQPLRLSGGTIAAVTEARATVTARVQSNVGATPCCAQGQGAVYLSDLWAWPEPSVAHEVRAARMRGWCERIAVDLDDWCGGEAAHPVELGLRLHRRVTEADDVAVPPAPRLARLVCLSPFDAALHDAVGKALERPSLTLFNDDDAIPSAGRWFASRSLAAELRSTLRREPLRESPACFVVDPAGPLARLFDEWIGRRRYGRVKLKLAGRDPRQDAERTAEVVREMRKAGVANPWISVDTNGACPHVAFVTEYLDRLADDAPDAYSALQYLEQPTARDLERFPHDWRPVARRKPVLIDESLCGMDQLQLAREQGWSGLALKTCKGHSFQLLAAAWARRNGLVCALQDLTNPGYAALHAASFASYVPTINGLELNSPQFTPDANRDWLPEHAQLLEPRDGVHRW